LDAIKDDIIVVAENGGFCKESRIRIVSYTFGSNITIIETHGASKERGRAYHPVLCAKIMPLHQWKLRQFFFKINYEEVYSRI